MRGTPGGRPICARRATPASRREGGKSDDDESSPCSLGFPSPNPEGSVLSSLF
jgi:hypothetical protein